MSTTTHTPTCLAPLERCPAEILAHIFVLSNNCDLPLTSRTLLATLSHDALLKRRLVVNIFACKQPREQTKLLRRRFFNLAVFDDAQYSCYAELQAAMGGQVLDQQGGRWGRVSKSPGRYLLNVTEGTQLNERLVCNFKIDPACGPRRRGPEYGADASEHNHCIWKLELLKRLFPLYMVSSDYFTPKLFRALRGGLDELVRAGSIAGVKDLFHVAMVGQSRSFINRQVIKLAIVELNCRSPEIVHFLLVRWQVDRRDYVWLRRWITERKETDRLVRESAARGEGLLDVRLIGSDKLPDIWLGEWVEDIFLKTPAYVYQETFDYFSFFLRQPIPF
ncbi:MAG: hypothetical protein M1829_000240 [Trizodia sp. TS-e1964]|nr:MAG: hypothetical protein M1829_000240 [Trizodia sp. TS-e1964]